MPRHPADPAVLRERVAAWRREQCDRHCPRCPSNCCSGRLNPRLDDLEAFASLPLVRAGSLVAPRPPYVSDRRTWLGGACYLVGPCPHLRDGRCDIFGEAGRPSDCLEYPAHVQSVLRGWAGEVINAERSCWMFGHPDVCADLEQLASELGVECAWHSPTPP